MYKTATKSSISQEAGLNQTDCTVRRIVARSYSRFNWRSPKSY